MAHKKNGWFGESKRHSLASKGVSTGHKRTPRTPKSVSKQTPKAFDGTLDSLRGKDLNHSPSGPGKFEGNYNREFAEAIHDVFMNGFGDEELGDVQDFGWYGLADDLSEYGIKIDGKLVVGAIANEDNSGFFGVETYTSEKQLKDAWNAIEKDYEKFSEDNPEGYR